MEKVGGRRATHSCNVNRHETAVPPRRQSGTEAVEPVGQHSGRTGGEEEEEGCG